MSSKGIVLESTRSSITSQTSSRSSLTKSGNQHPKRFQQIKCLFYPPSIHRLKLEIDKLTGYRFVIVACAWVTSIVLVTNVIVTIWAARRFGWQNGVGTILDGDCPKAKNLSTWIHGIINVLSTALVGASNYGMQCLTSPTRDDVDRAHEKAIWLQIGVPSTRNLRRISTLRASLWWLLVFSTIPLHLLWNSAVFLSLSARSYNAFLVSSSFFNVSKMEHIPISFSANGSLMEDSAISSTLPSDVQRQLGSYQHNPLSLQKLTIEDCVRIYTLPIISEYSDVLLVTSHLNSTNPIIEWDKFSTALLNTSVDLHPMNDWLCVNTSCSMQRYMQSWTMPDLELLAKLGNGSLDCEYRTDTGDCLDYERYSSVQPLENISFITDPYSSPMEQDRWLVDGYEVEHCLAQKAPELCSLQFNVAIMIVVIICNLVKALCMITFAWNRHPTPLVTIGDAIASFLDKPDQTTKGNCLNRKTKFKDTIWGSMSFGTWKPALWFQAASCVRWLLCEFFFADAFLLGTLFLVVGLNNRHLKSTTMSYLWSLGFGKTTSETITGAKLPGLHGVVLATLIVNAPQLILTFLYFTYNSLFTCMLVNAEWCRYAITRKSLRVSSPKGQQRSSYWLQLPYCYGIPLLTISTLLHWMVSQSIFLVHVNEVDSNGHLIPGTASVSTLGNSYAAIQCTLLVSFLALVFQLVNGFRKFKGGIPLMACNSARISAACHPPETDIKASLEPVKFGEVVGEDEKSYEGHCCFTSFEVSRINNDNILPPDYTTSLEKPVVGGSLSLAPKEASGSPV